MQDLVDEDAVLSSLMEKKEVPSWYWDRDRVTLREVLECVRTELRTEKRNKTEISHILAQGFIMTLEREGATVLEVRKGIANYFCIKVDGKSIGVSPFVSHDEWWEKPSEGFRQMVKERSCEWGVVLFLLDKRKEEWEGFWIEGKDFDEVVLKKRQTANSDNVRRAIRKGLARQFSDETEFLRLLKTPVRRAGTLFRIPRPSKK